MTDVIACTACGAQTESLEAWHCPQCWGPVHYRRDPAAFACAPGPSCDGLWRYAPWLPQDVTPLQNWPAGGTPLIRAPRLEPLIGAGEVWIKNETANPTHSFKDRVAGVAAARALRLGLHTVACTSTGNLGHALAAAAASAGLRCVVLVPASVEPEKTAAARALGAQVIALDGDYDAVNRTAHQLAGQAGWGWVNMTLRPFYAEGSKTVIWEVLDQLQRPPTDVVAPAASGSLYTKLSAGAAQAGHGGIRFHAAQAAGCSPIARAFAAGDREVRPVKADSRAHSLAIGTPADGDRALEVARSGGGRIVSVPEAVLPEGVAILGAATGVLTESAGAVTTLGAVELGRQGAFTLDSRVVLVITGDGLKGIDLVADASSAGAGAAVPACPDAVLDACSA